MRTSNRRRGAVRVGRANGSPDPAPLQASARRTAVRTPRVGGREPSDRLRNVRGNVHGIRLLDVHLVHTVEAADVGVRRRITRWATHRACAAAGPAEIGWITLDDGKPLPTPFDNLCGAFDRLHRDPQVPHSTVVIPAAAPHEISCRAVALPAITAAGEPTLPAPWTPCTQEMQFRRGRPGVPG